LPATSSSASDVKVHDFAAKPLVSVIIPTQNRAYCLPRALDSVYAQEGLGERFDVQTIVVDDASSDATPEVVKRYSDVRYIRLPEHRGAAAAYNAGLGASVGSYLSFLDDDDEWLPHKLQKQLPLLEAHPNVGVVYSQSIVRFQGKESLYPGVTEAPSGHVFLAMLVNHFCGHHASLLARREAFEKAGHFDESFASYEDYDMSLRLAFHSRFLFAPGAVDVYNPSPRGLWLSRVVNGAGADDVARVIEKGLQMLPESAEYLKVKQEARARAAFHVVYPLLMLGELAQAWRYVVATLRAHPETARYASIRSMVRMVAGQWVLAARAPIAAAQDVCAEIKAATAIGGVTERGWARCMVADIWADVARSRKNGSEAAYAAVRAVTHAPSYLLSKAVLRVVQGGRRRIENA
jgi:glycosyltransferase involved in cell wall biosynthesis